MPSTTFVSGTTITAPWLNDVNAVVYLYPKTDVFTATASQTTFTLSYAPSSLYFVQVFINGLRLSPTTDYTNVSTSIVLTSGATVSDEILVDYFHA